MRLNGTTLSFLHAALSEVGLPAAADGARLRGCLLRRQVPRPRVHAAQLGALDGQRRRQRGLLALAHARRPE